MCVIGISVVLLNNIIQDFVFRSFSVAHLRIMVSFLIFAMVAEVGQAKDVFEVALLAQPVCSLHI